ncbi:hypothetical protein BN137_1105 [Cronobacter condimenti 1330]|uniref:Uncharacterized protein n=1 Tax=Cronobacter condimenti 1330 TaxID=1073999 RepID=K8A7S2_9ENTR|nr:hypothetical protein BN137_1105 [Cronobacter condimenti 1330]
MLLLIAEKVLRRAPDDKSYVAGCAFPARLAISAGVFLRLIYNKKE